MFKKTTPQKTGGCGFYPSHNLYYLLTFTLAILTTSVSAQWTTQSPVPTHLDIRGTAAPATDRVFLATEDDSFDNGGSLFESNDGGITWVQLDVPASLGSSFYGLFFYDNLNGWAFGNEQYRTTNGGTNWTQIPSLGSTYFMEFYTASFGLAAGNFGQYISYDGGMNWVVSPNEIHAFDFINGTTGLGISNTAIYRTTDGGSNFASVYSGNPTDIAFLSDNIAIGIADDTFIRSTDGGLNWSSVDSARERKYLVVVSADIVLAWGRSGNYPDYDDRMFRSTDGGLTWTDLDEVIPDGVYAITVSGSQNIVAAGLEGNMYFSSDSGLTWTQSFISRGQKPGYLSSTVPAFESSQVGYFGYGAGFVIKTTDGGASWFQISSGTGESLQDIDRFPDGDMIIVGDNGTLLKGDGTSPWILDEVFTPNDLAAVHILSSTEAVVLDEEGWVYKSTDGGDTWVAATTKPAFLASAKDVHFSTMLDGWVIGQSSNTGALYHTTDGGNSWIAVTDFLGYYVKVDVVGTNIWAANVGGRYYRSHDGGSTWIQGDLPADPLQINDMDFYNENIGYAVGMWGYVFRTNDGGITWDILTTPHSNHTFTDIYLLGPNEFWLSTSNDVAYYTATGGQNWAVMQIGSEGFESFYAIAASPDGEAWTVGYQGYIEYFTGSPPPPLNLPPVASFEFITTGLTVAFDEASYDPDGTVVSWNWNFGDGNSSSEQNPTHTFDTANTYIVYLTVTDDDGETGSVGQAIVVQPGPGGIFGDFTEVTPWDSLFVTPQEEDFWVVTTAPADYDNDGDLDIAVLGYYVVYNQSVEHKLVLIRNDGPAGAAEWEFSYIDVPLGDLAIGSSDLAWSDVDGDGDLDLVVGTNGNTVLYRNDAGTLVLSDTELPGYWEDNDQADFDLRSITWADYDNDGDLDLLIPSVYDFNTFSYRTALMRNDGPNGTAGWNFTEIDSVFAPTAHAQSAWADHDGDGDLDLLLVNITPLTDDGFIRIYTNQGNGVFTGEDILGSLSVEHGEAQWGDYDGDGDLDILVVGNIKETNGTYNMVLRIYKNNSGTYETIDVLECISCEGWFDLTAATWADYDSDGDMDILLAGTYNPGSQIEGRTKIYINDNGVFTDSENDLPAPRSSGSTGGTFSWFDLDNDGDLDYFIAGRYFVPGGNGLVEAQMHIYRNDAENVNSPPSSPTGLEVIPQGENIMLLSWIAATDDHTPSLALTYDLELYHNNMPVDLPNRLPQPGSISAVTEWLLTELQDGSYEWSVRAVDAAYSGSTVATGQFNVGTTFVESLNATEQNYNLGQNHPNPFTSATTIEYQILHDGFVSLIIYNLVGKEVASLVNEFQTAGKHSITTSDLRLTAGMYFYTLKSGRFNETRKMIVLE
ncbi:MAG: VCBS repeat-containing protein [Bacteroidales bacterium]|nr:VCBS repeat-containing protein [Bacteroidales bacterium]